MWADWHRLAERVFPALQWWPLVNRQTVRADALAGITGAFIVLPQGIAFAMIAGLPPVYGLYTAIVIPIIAALFGSSRHLVSGPTTAISIVVFATVSKMAEPGSTDYIEKVLIITFLTGVFQLAFGLARMGMLVNFVSHVVVLGFTAGAALLIMKSQWPVLSGRWPGTAAGEAWSWGQWIRSVNPFALLVATVALGTTIVARRFRPRWPHLLVGMLVGTLLAWALGGEAVGIRLVGKVSSVVPPWLPPSWKAGAMSDLAEAAFAIALLGLIEAVAVARAIAAKTGQQIDGNQEFIGQGLSNLVGSFFSCYPASGSFTRSGVNFAAGAQTPLSAIFAAVLLLFILLLVSPLVAFLPMPAIGGIILLVAWHLIDFKAIKTVLRASKRQSTVLLLTFLATLFFNLEYAIYTGIFFSLVFYLQRTSTPNIAEMAPDPTDLKRQFRYLATTPLSECPQLKILRIDGSIFFGSVHHIGTMLRKLTEGENPHLKHVLIVSTGINFIDVAGCEWLVSEATYWRGKGGGLYLVDLKAVAQDSLVRGGFMEVVGEQFFYPSKDKAIESIYGRLDKGICATCQVRIFRECVKIEGGSV